MFELILFFFIIVLIIILFFLISKIFSLNEELASIQYLKRSQSVKYGQLTEQWIPFSDKYPYNSQNFRFIGKPIDGISFEEDKIIFVEFKTNKSQLSEVQRKIKKLVEEKKIDWFELKID
ncbi:MAG: Holliday junction resolvase-like protein [Candidatus ainarchaeum sp.]|nr:Holliday junction resolvase-like protein [Candidatus ainarchaeum sp.]